MQRDVDLRHDLVPSEREAERVREEHGESGENGGAIGHIKEIGIAIKGPTETPKGGQYRSANVRMRQALGLYVGLRPSLTLPFPVQHGPAIDAVVIRENLGGFYGATETLDVDSDTGEETATLMAKFTSAEIRRLTRYAALWARANGRKKVTLVTKANIMPVWGGVYLRGFHGVMADFPDLVADDLLIDAIGERLVTRPDTIDVAVLENLFGDIMSDVAGGMAGGLGLATGVNVGDGRAVYEAVHGTAPDIMGQDKANPLALILSAVRMLNDIGENAAAARIDAAVKSLIMDGSAVTGDLRRFYPSGTRIVGTTGFVRALCDRIRHL
ncbi:NAD-dependent isocitrate dehydrogenase [bacterium]|nr:NAD-dependent isocitrate dehydrogenase [bacterium]